MSLDFLQTEDGIGVAAVLALTEFVKVAFRVPARWVPVIPVLVAIPVALIYTWAMHVDPSLMARATAMNALKFAPLAMATYKIWKTTILNVDGEDDA